MRYSRRWWIWLTIPALFVAGRMLERVSCAGSEVSMEQVLSAEIQAAGLISVGENLSSRDDRGFFVAMRDEARCWGQLVMEGDEERTPVLEFLCTDDSMEEALVLPTSADSLSLERAQACSQQDLVACVNLGLSFERGQNGLRLDPGRFMRLFYEACEEGEPVGCMRSARHYTTRTLIPPEPQRALELYLRACAGGLLESCTSGLMLGVESGDTVRSQTLRQLAQSACNQEHADGCNTLGVMRHRGQGGDVDSEGAQDALQKACRYGSRAGCENLELEFSE